MVEEALEKAKLTEKNLSAVAVTIGPGLSLCLRSQLLHLLASGRLMKEIVQLIFIFYISVIAAMFLSSCGFPAVVLFLY